MGRIILPGATIGIIGGGQLGKMLAIAAQTLGYKVVIWSEEEDFPAKYVATETVIGSYLDPQNIRRFTSLVNVATVETEHIPAKTLDEVKKAVPIFPDPEIVAIAQNREREKGWLNSHNIPVSPFRLVKTIAEIEDFFHVVDSEIVVKTTTGGYDGKGQLHITKLPLDQAEIRIINNWLEKEKVLITEAWIKIEKELSVLIARNQTGEIAIYPIGENEHREHILHQTIVPAQLPLNIQKQATNIAQEIVEKTDYVGLLCIEFFYGTDNKLYVNELAPRPHNSGHYTIEASVTSQFEQTIRAICNLPLGETRLTQKSVMVNLLGDLWLDSNDPVTQILKYPAAKLHLYGKKEARTKRKMGHYTIIKDNLEEAIDLAKEIFAEITQAGKRPTVKK